MPELNSATHLTTSQVAEICADESTIRYLARTGILPGRKVGNRWQFLRSDAEHFCGEWRTKQEDTRDRANAGWSPRRTLGRVLQGDGVALLNLVASMVSLVTLAVGGFSSIPGIVLTFCSVLGAGLGKLWSRARRPRAEDVAGGAPVDPAAIEWSQQLGTLSIMQLVPIVTLLATTGYVAVEVSPIAGNGHESPGPVIGGGQTPMSIAMTGLSRPFTTCQDWLTGAGVNVEHPVQEVNDPVMGRRVVCDGREQDQFVVRVMLYFSTEKSPDNWAEVWSRGDTGCVTATVPNSGLLGCLLESQNRLYWNVRIRADLVIRVELFGFKTSEELRALAERIINHVADISLAS